MSDDGTSFTIDIPVTDPGKIDAAAASVDVLQVRLDSAARASEAASDAVKVAEASYAKAEANVDKLTRALERVGVAADAQKAKLRVATDLGDTAAVSRAEAQIRELARQEDQLTAKVAGAKVALDSQAASLDRVRSAATAAGDRQKKLQEELDKKTKPRDEEGIKWEKLERGLGKIGGPLAEVGQKVAGLGSGVGKLDKALGELGPWVVAAVGAVALASAILSVTAAIVTGIAKIGEWAVKLADANGTAIRLAQGMVRSKVEGQQLSYQMDQLTRKLPLTQEEISSTAKELANMGLRGDSLASALETAATRAARLKFGPDFADQMLTLDEQSKVFQMNLARTFGGLDTTLLMRALQMIVSLFDSSTESGRALKVVFESVFQPLVDKVGMARFKVEAFFLQAEILALKALIGLKPYGSLIAKVGEAFLIGAGIIVGVFAVALAAVVVGVLAVVAAFGALVSVTEWFTSLGERIGGALDGLSLANVGKSLMQGFADGIVAGWQAVVAAVVGAARGAVAAAKDVLGIHSPSTVFMEIGAQTGAGMRQGVEGSAPSVGRALERMSDPRSGAGVGGGAGVGATGSGGTSTNLSGLVFNFYGVEGAEDATARFREALESVIHGDATQLGGMASSAPA